MLTLNKKSMDLAKSSYILNPTLIEAVREISDFSSFWKTIRAVLMSLKEH